MSIINFYINGQKIKCNAPKVVVSDTINYLTASVVFDTSDYDGLNCWLHFAKGENVYDYQLDSDNSVSDIEVPSGTYNVYLHGNSDTKRIITNKCILTILQSGAIDGEVLDPIIPSEAEQIAYNAQKALETAEEAKEECDTVTESAKVQGS